MKIICIGRNYSLHAEELGNAVPAEPLFFLKPDSAILMHRHPFYIPDWTNKVDYEVEVVVKISKLGKSIQPEFAHRYYDEVGLGIDFTARDIQDECKAKGLPWERAKAFDQSAVIGRTWVKLNELSSGSLADVSFSLMRNGTMVQTGNTRDMLFSVDEIIAYVSRFMTLKMGDLIYTGTPVGVGAVAVGDVLEGELDGRDMFRVSVQ